MRGRKGDSLEDKEFDIDDFEELDFELEDLKELEYDKDLCMRYEAYLEIIEQFER